MAPPGQSYKENDLPTYIKGNDTSTFGGNVDVPQIITDAPVCFIRNSANQAISTATQTKVAFDTVIFDPTSAFNTTTYRFQPAVAGYYQINSTVRHYTTGSMSLQILALWKNGTDAYYLNQARDTSNSHTQGSSIIYLNGSTDYVEIYGRSDGTSLYLGYSGSDNCCYFSAALIRGA